MPNLPPMTEAQLQDTVRRLCKLRGIWAYHVHDSRRDEAGFPDLVLIGKNGAMFRELKTETGRLRPAQAEVGDLMRSAGLDWGIWRPSHLRAGDVLEQLEVIR